jgi:hypothetical protein
VTLVSLVRLLQVFSQMEPHQSSLTPGVSWAKVEAATLFRSLDVSGANPPCVRAAGMKQKWYEKKETWPKWSLQSDGITIFPPASVPILCSWLANGQVDSLKKLLVRMKTTRHQSLQRSLYFTTIIMIWFEQRTHGILSQVLHPHNNAWTQHTTTL